MNKVFVTSDTHFGHQNIIRYTNRPFRTWHEMGEAMIKTWNSRVGPDDIVYFLGDFAVGPGANTEYIIEVGRALNGSKFMIPGNHDFGSRLTQVMTYCKAKLIPGKEFNLTYGDYRFIMTHEPLKGWQGREEHPQIVHLHGHSHTQFGEENLQRMIDTRKYDIGVDMYGGPVELTSCLRFLNNPKGWA